MQLLALQKGELKGFGREGLVELILAERAIMVAIKQAEVLENLVFGTLRGAAVVG